MNEEDIFQISDDELSLVLAKNTKKNKLGFALLLKYFQFENHYPRHVKYIDPLMLNCIANQLNIDASIIENYDWEGRSTERYRQEIRELLGYRKPQASDITPFKTWLSTEVFPSVTKPSDFIEHSHEYFRKKQIEPFAFSKLAEHINSAYANFEKQFFDSIFRNLQGQTKDSMHKLLIDDEHKTGNTEAAKFKHLKKDVPGAKLKHVSFEIKKMQTFSKLILPTNSVVFHCSHHR
ncbi:MAG: hypothetical protein Tsb005_10600 [Gammaproteobacteria bacterium]